MPKINLLSKETAELIAAGEVVERPASVVKEMVENSIDAEATRITVEIVKGGIASIRITDDGHGIESADVPTAFLRHATSKIRTEEDLYAINTLGFRGEALAATSSVSKIELFTKSRSEEMGTHYIIEGGNQVLNEESACPDGTTIVIRDIFYNTPARMKFLKKDISEANACAAVVERAALSHPEIAFKFIRDGKTVLSTSGDGKLLSAIYSLLGREFSNSLIELNAETSGVTVTGYTTKPVFCRQSRAAQYTFLNGRLVRSGTVTAAAEQAYKNSTMVGKFPGFVICVRVNPETVDVNVHPAKTEVRFSDEKRIFDAVYYAVKNAIMSGDTRPVIASPKKDNVINRMSTEQYRQQKAVIPETPAEKVYKQFIDNPVTVKKDNTPFFENKAVKEYISKVQAASEETATQTDMEIRIPVSDTKKPAEVPPVKAEPIEAVTAEEVAPQSAPEMPITEEKEEIIFIGEAFATYIVAQLGQSIYLIDKHAAHERILFNNLKSGATTHTQPLLAPVTVRLGFRELDAVIANIPLFEKFGFEIEDFGNGCVMVRAIPSVLMGEDVQSVIVEAAASLLEKGAVEVEKIDKLYHTVACKAAIKAGMHTSVGELKALAERVLSDKEIMYCPHGRPVAFEIKKKDLEKQFGRIQ